MNFTEIPDGDAWELFCRDFFVAQNYKIDVPPGRGPDGGRDLVLFENLSGKLHSSPFRWLVSCKHYAKGGKAVGTGNEENIIERLRQHRANGFIGFYSTIPSAALIERLETLKANGDFAEYKLFDGAMIEGLLVGHGMSQVLLQHLPESYRETRPIHPFAGRYIPLTCCECGEDVIRRSISEPQFANIVFVMKSNLDRDVDEGREIEAVYVVCKGDCDRAMQDKLQLQRRFTSWDGFHDFTNPLLYIKRVCAFANILKKNPEEFSEQAFEQYKEIIIAASQLTMRHYSADAVDRYKLLGQVEF